MELSIIKVLIMDIRLKLMRVSSILISQPTMYGTIPAPEESKSRSEEVMDLAKGK
jgi:hypothetical protein